MSYKIFDLEQSILQCWNVCDDIDLIYSQVMERSPPLTQDELANILLGIKSLYQIKFDKCFGEFENLCSNYWKYKKFYEKMESMKDDLK